MISVGLYIKIMRSGGVWMKKMIIIIIILATILISMIIYKNTATGATNQVNIQEIQKNTKEAILEQTKLLFFK